MIGQILYITYVLFSDLKYDIFKRSDYFFQKICNFFDNSPIQTNTLYSWRISGFILLLKTLPDTNNRELQISGIFLIPFFLLKLIGLIMMCTLKVSMCPPKYVILITDPLLFQYWNLQFPCPIFVCNEIGVLPHSFFWY